MNIMIVGVGGQGTLLASRILGNTVINEGYDVKVSEVHGMSQRGGSVVTYVKYGEKVYSPIIDKGEADIILAFEKLEAYRAMPYLKKDGLIICNNQEINPMPVIIGATTYPENIFEKISKKVNLKVIDLIKYILILLIYGVLTIILMSIIQATLSSKTTSMQEAGNAKSVNVVLIGVMAKSTNISYDKWIEVIKATVKPQFIDSNIKAFDLGYNL